MAAKTPPADASSDAPATPEVEARHCGIIMPLSDTSGYDPGHWQQVQRLIIRAAEKAGFTGRMVSENDGQDMIHSSIIRNIYHDEIVVCDVSSLNPNVMLELGLRMATKKPLVLVFDGEDNYPFDIKNFIYADYPKGLHFFKIEGFVDKLSKKISQVSKANEGGTYEPYLSHFNDVVIEASKLESSSETVVEALTKLVTDVNALRAEVRSYKKESNARDEDSILPFIVSTRFIENERIVLDILVNSYFSKNEVSNVGFATNIVLEDFIKKYQKYLPEVPDAIAKERIKSMYDHYAQFITLLFRSKTGLR